MKAIKYTLILIAAMVIIGIAGTAYLVIYLGENKDLLARAASQAIGRAVYIDQGVSLNWSMTPSIAVEGFRMSNPEWLGEEDFVRAERAELEFDVFALLDRRLAIRQVTLHNTDVLLQSTEDGNRNWLFDGEASGSFTWGVDKFKAEQLRVHYLPAKGQAYDIAITELEVLGAGGNQLSIDVRFIYDDLQVALAMKSTPSLHAGQSLEFTAIKAKVGDHDFSGSMRIPIDSSGPVDLNLTMRELDLTPVVYEGKAVGNEGEGLLNKRWPLDFLPDLDIDFKLAIEKILTGDVIFKHINLDGRLAGRNLKLEMSNRAGNLATTINLKPQGRQWQLHLVNKSKLELGSLFEAKGLKESRSQALMTLNVDLSGAGQSLSAMLTSANGVIDVVVGKGHMSEALSDHLPLGNVILSVLNNIGSSETGKLAKLECAVLHLDVKDGVGASNQALALQTEKFNVLGDGTLKLDNGEIDLQFKILKRGGVGLNVGEIASKYIRLTGTLANPQKDVKVAGVVTHGAAAWATGGLSLLVEGLASRLTEGGNPCDTVLESLAKKN